MPRLQDNQIDQIKTKASLATLAEQQGHTLKSQGDELALCCPFHDDASPSCFINAKKNRFCCHGCGAKGDVIEWTMRSESLDFRQACDWLAKRFDLPLGQSPMKVQMEAKMLSADNTDAQLLEEVMTFYHCSLQQSQAAKKYLELRGLNHPELIERFKLGFSDRSLPRIIPKAQTKAGAAVREKLAKIGVLLPSGHERMLGAIVVPLFNEAGEVVQLYGRKIGSATITHSNLSRPLQGIWNREELAEHNTVILCESLIDAMTFWVHGFKNVTACLGTNGFTEEHLDSFKKDAIETVIVAFDRDEAGDKSAEELAQRLKKEGIASYRAQFPEGMDANGYALKSHLPEKALSVLLERALPLTDLSSSAAKAAIEAVEIISGEMVDAHTGECLGKAIEPPTSLAKGALKASPQQTTQPSPPAATEPEVPEFPVEIKPNDEIVALLGDRYYRIRGLEQNTAPQLKVHCLVRANDLVHVDYLDLPSAKARQTFIRQASNELSISDDVIRKDMGKLYLKLEQIQRDRAKSGMEEKPVELSPIEREEALQLLKDPKLMKRIINDFDSLGVVGEQSNKLVGYLATISRKQSKPLAILIQSSSAAGKSSLMDAVLNFVPEEDRVQYSAMTGQSVFYMGQKQLKHKILAIAEEEGMREASYALKLLQSDGKLMIASTGKDPKTGQLGTQDYEVEGPVMLFLTTTALDIDPELKNRCITMSVNESRDQTQAIHQQQRESETLDGLFASEAYEEILKQHRNAQRLIEPIAVVNPYAPQLTFVDDQTRTRRDHQKYLGLIRAITLLHQYQRPVKKHSRNGVCKEYIEATLDDIRWANQLAHEVLGRSLDELPPQTRKLLHQIYEWVQEQLTTKAIEQCDFRFTRKQIREAMPGWGNTQLKVHLSRLEDMEYLIVHGGGRGQLIAYELLYRGEGQDQSSFLMGLRDIKQLKEIATVGQSERSRGLETESREEQRKSRPQIGAKSGSCRQAETGQSPDSSKGVEQRSRSVGNEPIGSHATKQTNDTIPLVQTTNITEEEPA